MPVAWAGDGRSGRRWRRSSRRRDRRVLALLVVLEIFVQTLGNAVRALRAHTYYRLVGLAGRFRLGGVPAPPRGVVQHLVLDPLPCTGFVAERAGLGGHRGGVWHERAIDGERHELVVDTRCMSMRFHRHTDRPGPPAPIRPVARHRWSACRTMGPYRRSRPWRVRRTEPRRECRCDRCGPARPSTTG